MPSEYMNAYMAARRAQRRIQLKELLGGRCVECGSTRDLEFDHVDPATKLFDISNRIDASWQTLLVELAKCQLLCVTHHDIRTATQKSVEHGGGASGKKNCKCRPCRDRHNEYTRNYKRRARLNQRKLNGS